MQDCSLYLGKANLMQKIRKRGPQSNEILGQKFQWIYHLGKVALVKILEGTLHTGNEIKKKSNLHYTLCITPKGVTNGGAHLRSLASGLHSSEETSQRWRHCADWTSPEIKPQTMRTDSMRLTTELIGR